MSLTAISIEIHGKVQGVFYRASAKTKATELGLVGFVKNQVDGSVYIETCGDTKAVEYFIIWCLRGPIQASVTEIRIKKIPSFESAQFEIHR
jgi:acylphosphatase